MHFSLNPTILAEKAAAKECTCWPGYERVPGTAPCADGSCRKITKSEAGAVLASLTENFSQIFKTDPIDKP